MKVPKAVSCWAKKNSSLIGKNQSQAMKKEMCCSCNLVTASGIAGSRCSNSLRISTSLFLFLCASWKLLSQAGRGDHTTPDIC